MNGLVRNLKTITYVLLGVTLVWATVANSQERVGNTVLNLVSEVSTVEPGTNFDVAIHLEPDPGWHIYWINPGYAGLPPTIDWELPEGTTAGELQFKSPEFIKFMDYISYGYDGSTLFISTISVPETVADEITIGGKVNWLVCDDQYCIPEKGEISLTLPTGTGTNYSEWREEFVMTRSFHPTEVDWDASFTTDDNKVVLDIAIPEGVDSLHNMWFFPANKNLIDHSVAQTIKATAGRVRIETPVGTEHDNYDTIQGVLKTAPDVDGLHQTLAFSAQRVSSLDSIKFDSTNTRAPLAFGTTDATDSSSPAQFSLNEFLRNILYAFLGGLILNIMPCVLPILSLKALSIAEMAKENVSGVRIAGLAYTAGVLVCFLLLVSILIFIRSVSGSTLGWGFQLGNPYVLTVLALLLVAVGLNFSGVFEIRGSFANLGGLTQRLTNLRGTGDFFTGLLAVIIASPCTVPFMGVASGYALLQSVPVALAVFAGLSIGFAFPYLLITFFPFLRNLLPKPGMWMETFRRILAFPMYGTAIWLLWVLGNREASRPEPNVELMQDDINSVMVVLILMLLLALALWTWARSREATQWIWKVSAAGCAVFFVGFAAWSWYPHPEPERVEELAWSTARVEQFHAEGKPIFAYFTANWCVSCKANERVALHRKRTQDYFAENEVVVLVGDWTDFGDEIGAELKRHNRAGVPLYLYYKPGGDINAPVILPAALTPGIVINALENA